MAGCKLSEAPFQGFAPANISCAPPQTARMTERKDLSTVLPIGFIPSTFDVICGRDQDSIVHGGNQRLRSIVREILPLYCQAPTKKDKTYFVMQIVERIRQARPIGGFLRKDLATGRWIEIGPIKAREKVGHIIRNELKKQRQGKTDSSGGIYSPASEAARLSLHAMNLLISQATSAGIHVSSPTAAPVSTPNSESTPQIASAPLPSPQIALLDLDRRSRRGSDGSHTSSNSAKLQDTAQLWKGNDQPSSLIEHQSGIIPTNASVSENPAAGIISVSHESSQRRSFDLMSKAEDILAQSSSSHNSTSSRQETSHPSQGFLPTHCNGSETKPPKPPSFYVVPKHQPLSIPVQEQHEQRTLVSSPTDPDEERLTLRLLPLPDNLTVRESHLGNTSPGHKWDV